MIATRDFHCIRFIINADINKANFIILDVQFISKNSYRGGSFNYLNKRNYSYIHYTRTNWYLKRRETLWRIPHFHLNELHEKSYFQAWPRERILLTG